MKKNNRKFISGTNWALAGLMSLLGFSACDIFKTGADEYGTPYAEFVVSGNVTDENGTALQGMGVIVSHAETAGQNAVEIRDTSFTKENGGFEYHYTGFPASMDIHMKFEDISAENARFEPDSAKVSFLRTELKGGKGWYEGKAEKTVNIVLKNRADE
ncbi:MAG: radical SAM-associated putative lipoprotein [Tannerella sp.]|jgi:putative lipoprotein (rSAM/lipoprotein system)|nr:radical SAM-associated putative lipoprotein [Tannerella sp.]